MGSVPDLDAARTRIAELEAQLESAQHEAAVLRLQLDLLSTTDPVTGLANGHGVMNALEHAAADGVYTGSSYAVLTIDLPQLVDIATRRGGEVRDDALRHLGALVGGALRELDTVGRMDDLGFVAVLPHASTAGIKTTIDELVGVITGDDPASSLTPQFAAVVVDTPRPIAVQQVLQLVTEARERAIPDSPIVSTVSASEAQLEALP